MYVKCSEDSDRMNRKSPFSTTPLSFDAPSPANPLVAERETDFNAKWPFRVTQGHLFRYH